MSEERLKIAVFVDFDNIEIGVRNTLNRNFDIAAVLEAVKERGEIVTKVAYGDWKRSGEYGRAMGQHAIHMVQRNPTPGGDKNGADINLALDALEMAFTRDHINAFVIVGGDSDFITLVEKLKQYDKKVFVVGGRAFTSVILQKNCHEFIAYENLIRSGRRQAGRTRSGGEVPLTKVVPLVLRALKILTDREVSPQIGLLKSTLLQLDSTFTEKDYGATTFRDFVEKLARKGVISLKHMDRSIVVEPLDNLDADGTEDDGKAEASAASESSSAASQSENGASGRTDGATPDRMEEGAQHIRRAFEKAEATVKWPMYLRSAKQLIKAYDADFDEADYGFRGLQDALRHLQKSGFLRLDRNRSGVLRIFPGEQMQDGPRSDSSEGTEVNESSEAPLSAEAESAPAPEADRAPSGAGPADSEAEEADPGMAMEEASRSGEAEKRKPARKATRKKGTSRAKTTTRKAKTTRATKATGTKRVTKSRKASEAVADTEGAVASD